MALVVCLAPFVAAGTMPNLIVAIRSLGRHDMISGTACNLWWLVGYLVQATDSVRGGASIAAAAIVPVDIVSVTRFVGLGFPNPRYIGFALLAAAAFVPLHMIWHRQDIEQADHVPRWPQISCHAVNSAGLIG